MRRTKLQVHLEVLTLISDGMVKPTRIMYKANLSWTALKELLANMVSQNLIEEHDASSRDKRTKKEYFITKKGEQVLKYFKMADNINKVID